MTEYIQIKFIDEPIYHHNTEFPWRQYTKEQLLDEYKRLKRIINKNSSQPYPFSITGYKCSNYFFQYERMKNKGRKGRKSTIEFWNINKDKFIKYCQENNRELFGELNFNNHAPAQFPPVIAGKVYKYFNAKKVLDPYAGWGDRCIAALAMNIDYTGIDSNINLKSAYDNMISFYPSTSRIDMHYMYSENYTYDDNYDLVLSSPPFWEDNRLLEIYPHTKTDYKLFLTESLIPIINRYKKKATVCMYISATMYNDIVEYVGECSDKIIFKTSNCRKGQSYNTIYYWQS